MSDIVSLVSRGAAIKIQQKALSSELEEINRLLLEGEAGERLGAAGEKATVVKAGPKFAPDADEIEQARELVGDDEKFKKLFVRSVVWSPVKAVRHIAKAILTPGKLEKLNALCEKPGAAYVIWPK